MNGALSIGLRLTALGAPGCSLASPASDGITTDPHGAALTENARAGGGLDIEVSFH